MMRCTDFAETPSDLDSADDAALVVFRRVVPAFEVALEVFPDPVALAVVVCFLLSLMLLVLLAVFLLEEVPAFLAPGAAEVPSAVVERPLDRLEESPPRRRELLSDIPQL